MLNSFVGYDAMSEKRRPHAQVFDYPWCIYCGGTTAATTADHNPAKILFDGKLRPKGMEFPSCEPCNRGTKGTELIAALISRAFPDSQARWTEELQAILQAVSNNYPYVLRELRTPPAKAKLIARRLGMKDDVGFINLQGPSVSAHLKMFAAKFGYAFHYFATKKAIPVGGGVVSVAYSNVKLLDGHAPDDFIANFGMPQTLQQGVQHVGDQFRYAVQAASDTEMTTAFASFRQSIAIATFSADDINKLMVNGEMPGTLVRPGELQIPVPPPEFVSIQMVFPPRDVPIV
jgi:hypothetical protein